MYTNKKRHSLFMGRMSFPFTFVFFDCIGIIFVGSSQTNLDIKPTNLIIDFFALMR
jgi:hypothetical protein